MAFAKGLDYYNAIRYHYGHCQNCSTCASMYIRNRKSVPSLVDDFSSVLTCSEHNVFIVPRPTPEKSLASKPKILSDKVQMITDTTLLHGMALYHTERELDLDEHIDNQIRLLIEAYRILITGRFRESEMLVLVQKEELVLYMELTHPIEQAVTKKGDKITHPHVWIRTMLRTYGSPHTLIHFPTGYTESRFIYETVEDASVVLEDNPTCKVYVKYYIDMHTYKIKRCEIDVDHPNKSMII